MSMINGQSPRSCGAPMLIVCPACVSSYRIDPDALRAAGPALHCAQCGRPWVASSSTAIEPTQGGWLGPVREMPRRAPDGVGAWPLGDAVSLSGRAALASRMPGAEPAPSRERSAAPALLTLALGLGLGMAAVAWRETVVRTLPAAAPVFAAMGLPTGMIGLTFSALHSDLDGEGSGKVLTVEGEIRNGRGSAVPVPDLRIVVRDQAQRTLYSWVAPPPKSFLASGEALRFQSRLLAPPNDGRELMVSFSEEPAGGGRERVGNGQ